MVCGSLDWSVANSDFLAQELANCIPLRSRQLMLIGSN
jgi:hypothetical protein